MSAVALEPLNHTLRQASPKIHRKVVPFSANFSHQRVKFGGSLPIFKTQKYFSLSVTACSAATTSFIKTSEPTDVVYSETFKLLRTEKVEGKIYMRLNQGKDEDHWQLTVGCSLPGKWVLHWGVHYVGDSGSEWEQPPNEIWPSGSISIKDYAVETPLKKSSDSENGECFHEVNINFNSNSKISAINFVLKDEETGSWYQYKGRDFTVPLVGYLPEGDNPVGAKGFNFWPGSLFKVFLKAEESQPTVKESVATSSGSSPPNRQLEGFYEDLSLTKEVTAFNSLTVSVKKCLDTSKNLVLLETDLPGDVVVHWGLCRDNSNKKWEVPAPPHPPNTEIFRNKALRTKLEVTKDGNGAKCLFTLDKDVVGFAFALKLNDGSWLNNNGEDYFIPLTKTISVENPSMSTDENQEVSQTTFTDGIIKEIRNIVTDMSSEKKWNTKSKETHETILQEIERLAAEAYSIFRSSSSTFSEVPEIEEETPKTKITTMSSGTGSGYEILCQGFNWESHKSGRWYLELEEKSEELASLGFTVIWLPPPTESVSPHGYMPKDLYNLNSRYGTIDELKAVVKKFHEVGIKVLGDVVLNHRCAHFKNKNGIWNVFGGRLNWDDRAIVADDPHFQGRGNKSSGEHFHAAPNIDHSQDFVRKDIKEWLCWLRKDIGYDGWRIDFVRGFWGGYVKDYIEVSEPYFSVGEFWDSLSYTYGKMDYNQDPHRQRIIDWINATGGTAGAFDVTTKGVLHSVLEKCEYWRLSDSKGKPPGVVGWWPSRAVTFVENHDTGSTQGHWRFPGGKEMQGYAYILTHPGTPAVFYDHIFSHYRSEIASLLSIRTRNQIHCRSKLKIVKAERDVYAAIVDDKVAMKIGPGQYEPPTGPHQWTVATEGKDYKVWEAL